MNAVETYMLGRKLTKIAESAFPSDPQRGAVTASVRTVLVDVAENPDSSIGDVTARTGFPQSHVSASVARLRERGVLETYGDSADGRRTLVRLADGFRARVATRAEVPIEGALAAELGDPGADELARLTNALDVLAERLIPRIHERRGGPPVKAGAQ